MTYKGKVQNGVIRVEDGVFLPEGVDVQIEVADTPRLASQNAVEPSIWDKLSDLARWAESQPSDLPSDLAANHDHYLHGLPKRG